jgi:hypothetical protein
MGILIKFAFRWDADIVFLDDAAFRSRFSAAITATETKSSGDGGRGGGGGGGGRRGKT